MKTGSFEAYLWNDIFCTSQPKKTKSGFKNHKGLESPLNKVSQIHNKMFWLGQLYSQVVSQSKVIHIFLIIDKMPSCMLLLHFCKWENK